MRISKNWLLEWVDPNKSTQEICEQFTNAGLEVESCSPVASLFSGVVVAVIVAAKQHPDADKLQVCEVDDGQQKFQIVCGAKNARAGLKVALARVGAELPNDFKIKAAKLRGVESQGMLCSSSELGLAETSNGILELAPDAPLGTNLREYLQLDDEVIDINITPNRGDCLSIKGLAREIGVINEVSVTSPVIKDVIANAKHSIEVKVDAPQACPRYCARVIKGVDVRTPSPWWLVEKLRRGGIRSINPVVDVTNYVVLELGQPMHAFDLAKIHGGIIVRQAHAGEKLALLDEQGVALDQATLVIADHERALAIAGVMGGKESSVTEHTQDILLESAFFTPEAMMGKARQYRISTDSSQRFERGVDPEITQLAMQRASELIVAISGGNAGSIVEIEHADNLPKPKAILLRKERIVQLLGIKIPDQKVGSILQRLGMQIHADQQGWQVTTPLHRFDLSLEEDLVEELARIYGFAQIPEILPVAMLKMQAVPEQQRDLNILRQTLVERGYQETLTYSFIDPKLHELFFPQQNAIALLNPIANNMGVMRSSIWPSLITAVAYNQNHQQERIRLFEIARVFNQTEHNLQQPLYLAGVVSGTRYPEQWGLTSEPVDFYDVKADLAALIPTPQFVAATNEVLHPGQSAQILLNEEVIGWLGSLHPRLTQQLKLNNNIVIFELNLTKVVKKILPKYDPINKYPTIRRDLAIVVDERVTFQQVYDTVGNSVGTMCAELNIFDVYRGVGIPNNKKSMAIKMILQHPDRTLVDDEVAKLMQNLVSALQGKLQAELRE